MLLLKITVAAWILGLPEFSAHLLSHTQDLCNVFKNCILPCCFRLPLINSCTYKIQFVPLAVSNLTSIYLGIIWWWSLAYFFPLFSNLSMWPPSLCKEPCFHSSFWWRTQACFIFRMQKDDNVRQKNAWENFCWWQIIVLFFSETFPCLSLPWVQNL